MVFDKARSQGLKRLACSVACSEYLERSELFSAGLKRLHDFTLNLGFLIKAVIRKYPHFPGREVSSTSSNKQLKSNCLKRYLPLNFEGKRHLAIIDYGASENAISADEFRRRGLKITGKGREFEMANRQKTNSFGSVRLKTSFCRGAPEPTIQVFHVIEGLPVEYLVGRKFLDDTKTLTLHQDRLELVDSSMKRGYGLCASAGQGV